MHSFKDNAGRIWVLGINVQTVKRVRALVNVDLMDALNGDLIQRLSTDPVLLCDTLYAICKPECDAQSVTDEQFGSALAGDAIDAAAAAFMDELVDFSPAPRRGALAAAIDQMRAMETRAGEVALAGINSPEMAAKLEQALQGPISEFLSANSPESVASIPDP